MGKQLVTLSLAGASRVHPLYNLQSWARTQTVLLIGVHVSRRVAVARGHDIDHVTIQHLQMVVPIALDSTMRKHNDGSYCIGVYYCTTQCYKQTCPLISFVPFMNLSPTHCEVYWMQHHVINYISELW